MLENTYVPGTPGAPWTKEEVLIVKSKLFSIFHAWGGDNALLDINNGNRTFTWMDVPDHTDYTCSLRA